MKYYNKINRSLLLNLKLYFNEVSHNRVGDSKPRYYLEIVGIESLDRIAETENSIQNGYNKYNSKFYGGKPEPYLKKHGDVSSLLLEQLRKTAPYGFDSTSQDSISDYNKKVKYNHERQSFYKTYWENHASEVIKEKGSLPYIKVSLNQVVKYKHLTQTPPTVFKHTEVSAEYGGPVKPTVTCAPTSINVTYVTDPVTEMGHFWLNGVKQDTLFLSEGRKYTFNNVNNDLYSGTCVNGAMPFRLSVQPEGVNTVIPRKGTTYTNGVNLTNNSTTGNTETLELTVTSSTPRVLSYYSPYEQGIGGVLNVHPSCVYTDTHETYTMDTPSINWSDKVLSSVDGANNLIQRNVATGFNDHCINNSTRGWDSYPNADNLYGISGQNYSWQIPSSPTTVEIASGVKHTRTPMGPIGVASNGIPIYNVYDENGGAMVEPNHYSDECNGSTDREGKYNYKINPSCLYTDVPGEHSPIIGYAFDGYPIYGPRDDDGTLLNSSDLDAHHGHSQPGRGYHYHVTNQEPYIIGPFYKGTPNTGNFLGYKTEGGLVSSNPPPGAAYPKQTSALVSGISIGDSSLYLSDHAKFNVGDKILIDPDTVREEVVTIYHNNPSSTDGISSFFPVTKYSHDIGAKVKTQSIDNSTTS